MLVSLDLTYLDGFVDNKLKMANPNVIPQLRNDPMGGWIDLPTNYDREEFTRILAAAKQINTDSEYLVCIGIGGSYLGHKAVIDALGNTSPTKILYAGNSLDALALQQVIDTVAGKNWSINVISKSGTTTEPAIAFRILREKLVEQFGAEAAAKRIYATTDANKGALHDEAVAKNYTRFVVPDNIGGRYSVLTAVGLLPIAAAGIDIQALMDGAAEERNALLANDTAATMYASVRNHLLEKGFNIEIFANFDAPLNNIGKWWEQLAGESEGKQHKGIFPSTLNYTTDLHSVGQYVQEGRRALFESVVKITTPPHNLFIPETEDNTDGLDYLAGKNIAYVNDKTVEATASAHHSGGVPVILISIESLTPRSIGALIYFYELSIAISGIILGVNPFDQPGVEVYKTNLFTLMGKPGYGTPPAETPAQ